MRPLELELVAFRSYDHAVVDWRPHDLVVIAGDTGAGKTTLLDAIAFALFGKTPEHGRTKDLQTLGHTHGEVRLTFALREQVWRVTRRYGKDAPDPAVLLERLSADGGDPVDTYGDHVDERLRALVGLSFEAFTSAVLLAQGRFAQFLASAPRERDDILRELFAVQPLDGVRQAAQWHHSELQGRAEGLRAAAAGLPVHTAAARHAAARAARDAAAVHAGVRGLRAPAERAMSLAGRATEDLARAAEIAAAADLLPGDAAVTDLAGRLRDALARAGAADAALRSAETDHAAAVAARDATRARHGGGAAELAVLGELAANVAAVEAELPRREADLEADEAAIAALGAEVQRITERGAEAAAAHEAAVSGRDALKAAAGASARAEAAAAAVTRHHAARDTAIATHDAAVDARAGAQAAHDAAVRRDAALAVRATLSAGDTCPVCGGAVGDHPAEDTADLVGLRGALEAAQAAERAAGTDRVRAVSDAERAEDELRDALQALGERPAPGPDALQLAEDGVTEAAALLQRLRDEHRAGATRIAALTGGVQERRTRLVADREHLRAAHARLGAWAGDGDTVDRLDAAGAEVRASEAAADAASAAVAEASAQARGASEAVRRMEAGEVAAIRAAVARAAAAAGVPEPGGLDGPEGVLAGCTSLRAVVADRAERAAADAARVHAEAERVAQEVAARGAAWGVTAPEAVAQAVRAAETRRRETVAVLVAVEATAAEATRLAVAATNAEAEAALFNTIARDLQANGFPRFLLARFRERLAAGASARLQELSAGAYRFSGREPDPLAVVDLRRGERQRAASTLSGGERFMASLALALGLSDIAAESGGRLDCLFLDEGFSTLDAESLEQALAGVERLAGDGRLIAVITHLPGVADRLGTTIRVAKDPQGASRMVDGAGGAGP